MIITEIVTLSQKCLLTLVLKLHDLFSIMYVAYESSKLKKKH